ncbi:hypothetical protein MMC25_000408 [Agyrium rufum]|nr:hypothetical protein [Agyrium rufum]
MPYNLRPRSKSAVQKPLTSPTYYQPPMTASCTSSQPIYPEGWDTKHDRYIQDHLTVSIDKLVQDLQEFDPALGTIEADDYLRLREYVKHCKYYYDAGYVLRPNVEPENWNTRKHKAYVGEHSTDSLEKITGDIQFVFPELKTSDPESYQILKDYVSYYRIYFND